MAKIKITESQLKMIAKHKALNEMMDEPELESNSKHYTMIWTLKGPTRVRHIEAPDPIVAYKKFMADVRGGLSWKQTIDDLEWDDIKLDELNGFKTVRESDLHGVVFYFDGFLSDDEIDDILDIVKKGEPGYQSNNLKKHKALNESFVEPKKFKHQYSGELRDAVNKLRKITPEMMDSLSEEKMMELDEVMSNYDDGVGDGIMEIVHSIGDGRYENDGYIRTSIEDDIIDIVYDRIASKGTDKNFIFDAIDDFAKFFGVDDGEEDEYGNEDMPGFEGTMSDLDNLSIREDSISLNEGQLLLKKVFNQFK